MQVLHGSVSRVARSAGIDDGNVAQIITFQVGRSAVEMWMPRVPSIENGDEVVVAGRVRRGKIEARAYYNVSNGVRDRWNIHHHISLSLTLVFAGSPLAIAIAPPLLLLILFGVLWALWNIALTFRAYQLVCARGRQAERRSYEPEDAADHEPSPVRPAPPPALPRPVPPPPPAPAATEDVSLPCPECGKRLRVSRASLGKKVRCPSKSCEAVFYTVKTPG
jgi:hypothetical protein